MTRTRQQSAPFARLLEAAGAQVLEIPTISIEPPPSWEPLDRAIAELPSFRWVVFTSVNGVEMFRRRLEASGKEMSALSRARLAAIGPATGEALCRSGLRPELIPEEYRAEALLDRLRREVRPGDRILIPRAAQARDLLVTGLTEWGARVVEVPAYRTRPARDGASALRAALRRGEIDAITFTSSSTLRNFAELFSPAERAELLKDVVIAVIGPITAETARSYGWSARVMPRDYTIPALAAALIDYFREERS